MSTKENVMSIRMTFTEPLLGTLPANPEIAKEFILSKFPGDAIAEDEESSLPSGSERFDKAITVFARDGGKEPMLWDYQVKGFFKDSCLAMIESGVHTGEHLKPVRLTSHMYKREIDNLVFVSPRRIRLDIPPMVDWPEWDNLPKGPNGLPILQRPLRKDNLKGGQVCLAASEAIPPGTSLQLEITVLNVKLMPFIENWLDYGALKGMGQWRNAGFGRFSWLRL